MSLWGFADLHAHPASHLGFGANDEGKGGIFWGQTGLRFEDAERTIATDLSACSPDKHAGFDEDPVRHLTRKQIIKTINQLTGRTHIDTGWPSFEGWPHALSVLHQQMHITWIRRAWQGGLRLLVASVTDNETLTMLWHRGFNLFGSHPKHDPNFDFESARKQLTFLHQLVEANSSWMEICTSPSQARTAIEAHKLAVVLSLEMDSLTMEQILTLKQELGVRHITPIHLVNNRFGGVAVYSDVFNTHNYFVNEQFYQVTGDRNLTFRLSKPDYPAAVAVGAIEPKKIEDSEYRTLGYECFAGHRGPCVASGLGHKNVRGLMSHELKHLMREGLLIDLAHMSDEAQHGAIELAERYNYPMSNTHTGLRNDDAPSDSERAMRRSLAVRLGNLGGVIGLGTEGHYVKSTLLEIRGDKQNPVVRFTGDRPTWEISTDLSAEMMGPATRMRVLIRTGGDDLRGGSQAYAVVEFSDLGKHEFSLNQKAEWKNNTEHEVVFDLPQGAFASKIKSFWIRYTSGGGVGTTTDNWNVDRIRVQMETGHTILSAAGGPVFRFTGERRVWALPVSDSSNIVISRLRLTIRTGGDDLRQNSMATAILRLHNGNEQSFELNNGQNWPNGSINKITLIPNQSIRASDIESLRITFKSGRNNVFDTGDNWNIYELRLDMEDSPVHLLDLSGRPLARFMGEQPQVLFLSSGQEDRNTSMQVLRVSINTGDDDLRRNSHAFAKIILRNGSEHEVPLNLGANWENDTLYHTFMFLPQNILRGDIVKFLLRYQSGREDAFSQTDNWTVVGVRVDILEDPIANWVSDLIDVQNVLGNRGVALGTDMNGYAPQIPFTANPITYPNNIVSRFGGSDSVSEPLANSQVSTRAFDVHFDGVAHYGMLPDMLAAASESEGGEGAVAGLFRSAEDFVLMWEKCEAAAMNIIRGAIGGYDLLSEQDQIIAFDYTGSGKLDHLLAYRPGAGIAYILANNAGSFMQVKQGKKQTPAVASA